MLVIGSIVGSWSCSRNVTGVERQRVLAYIAGYGSDSASIRVEIDGRHLTVEVDTYGDGCFEVGDTEVSQTGSVARIVPFDVVRMVKGGGCTSELRTFVHGVDVVFDQDAPWTLEVVGRKAPSGEVVTEVREVSG